MKKIKKWKKTGKPTTLFSKYGKFIRREFFIDPRSGKKEEYIFVGEADSVGILAITSDDKAILINQFKHASGKILTEIPAGIIEKGESPLEAARRELEEETGYGTTRIRQIGKFMRSTRSIPSVSYCFLASGCFKLKNPRIDTQEESDVVIKPIGRWMDKVKAGNIQDCLSVVTTLLAEKYIKSGK